MKLDEIKNRLLNEFFNKENGKFKSGKIYSERNKDTDFYKAIKDATASINTENPTEMVYCIINNINAQVKCKECNDNKAVFRTYKHGYGCFCSKECRMEYDKKNVFKKMQKGLEEKYGVDNISKVSEIVDKRKSNNLKKYGNICTLRSEEAIKKSKETTLIKYGVEHASKSEAVKEKKKKYYLDKYGVETNLQIPEVVEKAKNASLKVRKKAVETLMKSTYEKILSSEEFRPLFDFEGYKGRHNSHIFLCKKCNKEFEDTLYNGPSSIRCNHCYPTSSSFEEVEVYEFVKSLDENALSKDRILIKPYELDILVPDRNIAVEYNGVYWHSSASIEDDKIFKIKHIVKTQKCEEHGVRLFHIFESEWRNDQKKEIWKSILQNALCGASEVVFARKCSIKEVSSKVASEFCESNHLQGKCRASINIALEHNGEIVSMVSFGKSRFNKEYEYEILRFASKLNVRVTGGFSKIIKYFIKSYNPESVITYADRRYSEGDVYKKNGFNFLHETTPGYYYVKGSEIFNRINFQKHKLKNLLENFDASVTEHENMYNNGFRRIWDCGNYAFGWKKN